MSGAYLHALTRIMLEDANLLLDQFWSLYCLGEVISGGCETMQCIWFPLLYVCQYYCTIQLGRESNRYVLNFMRIGKPKKMSVNHNVDATQWLANDQFGPIKKLHLRKPHFLVNHKSLILRNVTIESSIAQLRLQLPWNLGADLVVKKKKLSK